MVRIDRSSDFAGKQSLTSDEFRSLRVEDTLLVVVLDEIRIGKCVENVLEIDRSTTRSDCFAAKAEL